MSQFCNASFGIGHLTDYIWQHFKNRSFFFNNCLGQCSVEVGLLYILGFCFLQNAVYLTKKMGPKKDIRVRKIKVPTDGVPEFELGDTAAKH